MATSVFFLFFYPSLENEKNIDYKKYGSMSLKRQKNEGKSKKRGGNLRKKQGQKRRKEREKNEGKKSENLREKKVEDKWEVVKKEKKSPVSLCSSGRHSSDWTEIWNYNMFNWVVK